MIGIFDSGYGGLTVARALFEKIPEYSYVYFGDNAHAPYGNRTREEIINYTIHGVRFLFEQGCDLVVLACNTASTIGLRVIQQECIPATYPGKRVLGIVVPTIEQITGIPWKHTEPIREAMEQEQATVGILATEQTVKSGVYEVEITKRNPNIFVVQQICDGLVEAIEAEDEQRIQQCVQAAVEEMHQQVPSYRHPISTVLLGCTHFELVKETIADVLPDTVRLYGQPMIVAQSLREYLERHAEKGWRIDHGSSRVFFTSGHAETASAYATKYLGYDAKFMEVDIR